MNRLLKFIVSVFFLLLAACVMFAQPAEPDLRQEIDDIKQNQQAIQQDLSEIKALLSKLAAQNPLQKPAAQQPPQIDIKGIEFNIGDNPILGKESARLILVEITDYQCPFCGRYSRETFPQLRERYVDKGLIRYAVIDQPLTMHPEAAKAAEAAHCAENQGKFWEMHDEMMAKQDGLKDLTSYAETLKMNVSQFEDCLNTGKYRNVVSKNMETAKELGINGVPFFIIATVDESDSRKATGVSMIRGAVPFANFLLEIDAALQRE